MPANPTIVSLCFRLARVNEEGRGERDNSFYDLLIKRKDEKRSVNPNFSGCSRFLSGGKICQILEFLGEGGMEFILKDTWTL